MTPFLKTSRVTFFFKVLITNAGPCGYFNAIFEMHLRYSLFVKRIIAIEAQLYFLDLLVPLAKQNEGKHMCHNSPH